MLKTLHGYLSRELLKTFAMTAAALTTLLVMGGGVANMFRAPGLGASEMGKLFAFFTPVALTMILPIAALFSTTICYGRAAADNEITAAKAAGINVHRLLLSAGMLGLFVTAATYFAWNFMIPLLSGKVEELTRRDLPKIIVSQFQHNKALVFGKYRLYADSFEPIDNSRLPPDPEDPEANQYKSVMALLGVSFIEVDDDQMTRFGTSDVTYIIINQSPKLPSGPTVFISLTGVRAVDRSRPVTQAMDVDRQNIGPLQIPLFQRHKMKFQNLPTLQNYLTHADEIPEVSDLLFRLKRSLMEQYLFQDVVDGIKAGYTLRGPDTTYRIKAERLRQAPGTNQPELAEVTVEEVMASGESRVFTASRATVDLKNSFDRENPNVVVELTGGVKVRQIPGTPNDRIVTLEKQSLVPVSFLSQPSLKTRLEAFEANKALDPEVNLGPSTPKLDEARANLIKRRDRFLSEVKGEIHFRASYAASAIAVILLGAMLGIVLRGGQVLTAFGISCLPTAFVVVASIVGRNLADQPDKTLLSLCIMWGATILMYLATVVVGLRVLHR